MKTCFHFVEDGGTQGIKPRALPRKSLRKYGALSQTGSRACPGVLLPFIRISLFFP